MRKTMSSSYCIALLSLFFCILLQKPTQAIKQSYIVYLGPHSHNGRSLSSIDVQSVTNAQYNLLGSYVGSTVKAKEAIFYSYNRYFNGFAAILDENEAAMVAKHPSVVSVFLNKARKLHTTRSWNFLGLERNGVVPKGSIWEKSQGEDVIIGNFDTGVWPESKSFSDEGMGPIPAKWRGICQVDKNNTDNFHCNRKLIGARYFYEGYQADAIQHNTTISFNSARDYEGHGTHTLSTAGGNFVAGASVFGYGNGTSSGGSPKARVAAYKVCWPRLDSAGGCFDSDILAAFEAAISDGVDVLSVSLGGGEPPEYFQSGISIGSFHAAANGIVVVTSGGNSGPIPFTVANLEPWVLTVAASSIDRDFVSYVTLGNKKILKGASLSVHELPPHKMYSLISAGDAKLDNATMDHDAYLCKKGALDSEKAKGKILVCFRGDNDRTDKGVQAAGVSAVGMILANDNLTGNDVLADPHLLPASHISFMDGSYILDYIKQTKSPVAYISRVRTQLGIKPSPVVASFSARGPNFLEPSLLKPDIMAPGVNIIASYSEATSPSEQETDKRRTRFLTMSGTSMACPHVAGLVGLLKALHPDWSPAAIKSAIMTTATTTDNIDGPMLDSTHEKATPFAYGAGHIRPNRVMDPGLVYDLNITDYLNFLCGHGYNSSQLNVFHNKPHTCPKSFNLVDFNYPTITIPDLKISHSVNVTRILTNVGSPSTYSVHIEAPPELLVSVEPNTLRFKEKGERREFRVTLTLGMLPKDQGKYIFVFDQADYLFGSLEWTDGQHHVKSPIVVKYSH